MMETLTTMSGYSWLNLNMSMNMLDKNLLIRAIKDYGKHENGSIIPSEKTWVALLEIDYDWPETNIKNAQRFQFLANTTIQARLWTIQPGLSNLSVVLTVVTFNSTFNWSSDRLRYCSRSGTLGCSWQGGGSFSRGSWFGRCRSGQLNRSKVFYSPSWSQLL